MSIMEIAVEAEKELDRQFGDLYSSPFQLDSSQLYGVDLNARGEFFNVSFLASSPDVYDLISTPASFRGYENPAFVVVTTGWAAPLDEDGEVAMAPSKNPERRRIRLAIAMSLDGVASVMRFEDDPENPLTDPGQATGALADAVYHFIAG